MGSWAFLLPVHDASAACALPGRGSAAGIENRHSRDGENTFNFRFMADQIFNDALNFRLVFYLFSKNVNDI
jgi:hypothetical protein